MTDAFFVMYLGAIVIRKSSLSIVITAERSAPVRFGSILIVMLCVPAPPLSGEKVSQSTVLRVVAVVSAVVRVPVVSRTEEVHGEVVVMDALVVCEPSPCSSSRQPVKMTLAASIKIKK